MASFSSSNFIKELRIRRNLLIKQIHRHATGISRIENGHQVPRNHTTKNLLSGLDICEHSVFALYLENLPMYAYDIRAQILFCLDNDWVDIAESLLKELEPLEDFDKHLNLQFWLLCQSRISYMKNESEDKIIHMVKQGLEITYPNFEEDQFRGALLISEEIELMYTLTCTYERKGDMPKALQLLRYMQKGLSALPQDSKHKEKYLPKILLTLSNFLIKSGQFEKALEGCKEGIYTSLMRTSGNELADLFYNKAYCLLKMGDTRLCEGLLYQAYFAYTLLHKKEKAEEVLKNAKIIFDVSINTYNTEKINYHLASKYFPLKRGESVKCKRIGEFIQILRTKANLPQKDIYYGVCSQSNFSKIESGEILPNVYYLEVFMQRLGRDVDKYLHTFLGKEEFNNKQLRDEILVFLGHKKADLAEPLLNQLMSKPSYQKGINLQFIEVAKSSILYNKEGYSEEYLTIVQNALKLSIPDFDERKIEWYHLSYYEISLINKMACALCDMGKNTDENLDKKLRGVKIFERLKASIEESYEDETAYIGIYITVLYNYSKHLGLLKRYEEALEIVSLGELLCIKHSKFNYLGSFAINKACDLLELGRREESIPCFAQAYYGHIASNRHKDAKAIKEYVKKKLNIDFAHDDFFDYFSDYL